jgi:hypothetical protein
MDPLATQIFIYFIIFFYTFIDIPTDMSWFSPCFSLGIFKISRKKNKKIKIKIIIIIKK